MKEKYIKDFKKILKAFPLLKQWEINQLKKRYRDGIHEFKTKDGFIYTNDPVKMLGCGTAKYSSYSPRAPFYKHLPSWICQDYVGMIYYEDGRKSHWTYNGVDFSCPYYLTRAFVIRDGDRFRIFPSYGDFCLEVDDGRETIIVRADCPPPTIHLDEGFLCKRDDGKGGHIAIFADRIPSQDQDCFRLWDRQWGYEDE